MKTFFKHTFKLTLIFSVILIAITAYTDSQSIHLYIPYMTLVLAIVPFFFFFDLITRSILKIKEVESAGTPLLICYLTKIFFLSMMAIYIINSIIPSSAFMSFMSGILKPSFFAFAITNLIMFLFWIKIRRSRN